MKFIIEPNVFHEDLEKETSIIAREIFGKDNITEVNLCKLDYYKLSEQINSFNTFTRGSFFLLSYNKRYLKDLRYFECTSWMPWFKEHLVTKDYAFLDLWGILDLIQDQQLFVRPNATTKDFAGQVFNYDKLFTEYQFMIQNHNIEGNILCCYGSPVKIDREYRCLFFDHEFIGSSQYMKNGELFVNQYTPSEVIEFAAELAEHDYLKYIFPDYTIDIGVVNGELRLVEINPLFSASWYAADRYKIFQTIKEKYD